MDKEAIRRAVWAELKEKGLSRFPFVPVRRIPNFSGAREAAFNLFEFPEIAEAKWIKCNPDSAQRPFREEALRRGKNLLLPTPRLTDGFWVLESHLLLRTEFARAATKAGVETLGRRIALEDLPKIDAVVVGSVAVDGRGGRIGKGHGYADLEAAILSEWGFPGFPTFTSVHEIQFVESIPLREHDVCLTGVATPSRFVRTGKSASRPVLNWEQITAEMLGSMPLLRELHARNGS